jgi:hypothetical protein
MAFSPEPAKPLNALAEVLLRGPNTLTRAEREMIATYVSFAERLLFLPERAWSSRGAPSGGK